MNKAILDKDSIHEFLAELGMKLKKELTIFMIGGGAMCLKDLKASTVDIDLIVNTARDYGLLSDALSLMDYKVDKKLLKERIYDNAVIVFLKGSSRIDIFIKSVVGMLDFSKAMQKHTLSYKEYRNLEVKLASNEDIFLLKSIPGREKDLPDCKILLDQGLNWNIISNECIKQHREETKWVFWLYEQLCRVENRFEIETEEKSKIWGICKKNWKYKPEGFMEDIAKIEEHIKEKKFRDKVKEDLKGIK